MHSVIPKGRALRVREGSYDGMGLDWQPACRIRNEVGVSGSRSVAPRHCKCKQTLSPLRLRSGQALSRPPSANGFGMTIDSKYVRQRVLGLTVLGDGGSDRLITG